jgi:hypothetical protein
MQYGTMLAANCPKTPITNIFVRPILCMKIATSARLLSTRVDDPSGPSLRYAQADAFSILISFFDIPIAHNKEEQYHFYWAYDIASNAVCTVQVLRQLVEAHLYNKKEFKVRNATQARKTLISWIKILLLPLAESRVHQPSEL